MACRTQVPSTVRRPRYCAKALANIPAAPISAAAKGGRRECRSYAKKESLNPKLNAQNQNDIQSAAHARTRMQATRVSPLICLLIHDVVNLVISRDGADY